MPRKQFSDTEVQESAQASKLSQRFHFIDIQIMPYKLFTIGTI